MSQNFQSLILFFLLPVNWVDFKAYQRFHGVKIPHHSPVHIQRCTEEVLLLFRFYTKVLLANLNYDINYHIKMKDCLPTY